MVNTKSQTTSVYLIDISSLFFRSYYAISLNMKNQKGLPTNALYGVLKMIEQISRKKNPDFMICCFDTKEGSFFRKELYPQYKANRTEMPEDLEAQVPYLKILMEKLLIPCFEQAGMEADDLIASLITKIKKEKDKTWKSFIVSGDKDFAQIVGDNVFLYDTMKEVIYDSEGVEAKWQLPPSQMKDYLSLTGDSSDNIPGVKGIGPKGAVQLLKEYNSLENIYDHLATIKNSLQKKLSQDKEMAFLSRKLIELKQDVKIKDDFFEKKYKNFSQFSPEEKGHFKAFLEELEFKSYLKKLFGKEDKNPSKNNSQKSTQNQSQKTASFSQDHSQNQRNLFDSQDSSKPHSQDQTHSSSQNNSKLDSQNQTLSNSQDSSKPHSQDQTHSSSQNNSKLDSQKQAHSNSQDSSHLHSQKQTHSQSQDSSQLHSQKQAHSQSQDSSQLYSQKQDNFYLQKARVNYKKLSTEEFKRKLEPYSKIQVGCYEDQFYLLNKRVYVLLSKEEFKSLSSFLDYKWLRYSGHDLKSFWRILKVKNPVPEYDSLIAGHLTGSLVQPSLKKLFEMYLNIPSSYTLQLEDIFYQEQLLKNTLLELLKKEDMDKLYEEIELALIPVLYEMEQKGFCIDLEEITKQSLDLEKDISQLEIQIHKMTGEDFNLASPKQLGQVLFEKLNLPKGRKTKTGYSTDSHELLKIKHLHPVMPLLLEHRELSKLKNTYTDPLIQLRNPKTGRIHTEFKQASVTTGRLASLNPNLQNIPIRTERGHLIRKAFITEPEQKLIAADYSQIELRILAEITGDTNLKTAFEKGLDIHTMTASEVFNIPMEAVSSDLRRKSKAVNFGIAYGQGAYGLAETLSIPRSEAKQIIENYFKKFKKIKDYIESVKETLTHTNYVKTLYGRKRFFDTDLLKHPKLKSGIERAAINAPLQGTASDLVKKAMIQLNESLLIPILSQVHDELLFSAPEACIPIEQNEIRSLMEQNNVLKVPLKVNLSVGKNWFDMKNLPEL